MKILVVEPHADDAYLSVGWHVESLWAEHQVAILTVYSDEKRDAESKVWADKVGADHTSLGLPLTNMAEEYDGTTEPKLLEFCTTTAWDVLVIPVGLQHPDHIKTRETLKHLQAWHYLDTPYCSKIKNAEEMNEALQGSQIVSIAMPHGRKWRHIPLYKSQSKFFYFTKPDQKPTHETIIRY